jgi:acyl-CoA thioester hydrolase
MPRPAPWRLDAAAYPHRQAVQTRFQDLDVLGHLNNVAFAALFETGRTKFNRDAALWGRRSDQRHAGGMSPTGAGSQSEPSGRGRRAVVAHTEINYLAEGQYPDDVEVATGIGRIGGRSWEILAAMFQGGRCIATCDVTIVMDKDEDGGGLPDPFRAELTRWTVVEKAAD